MRRILRNIVHFARESRALCGTLAVILAAAAILAAVNAPAVVGASAVKLIHGYGSTGRGGKIRVEVRTYLERQKQRGRIRDFIPGERFSIFDEATRRAFGVCDGLRRDSDLDAANNGVTFVIL